MRPDRRTLLLAVGAAGLAGAARADEHLILSGRPEQGGYLLGQTWPHAQVFVDGEAMTAASPDGRFIVGLDRDAAGSVEILVREGPRVARRIVTVAPGDFPTSRIDGLPPATVQPSSPEVLARIRREAALKAEAFASLSPGDAFRDGFVMPLERWRVSSEWGAQRILNGTPARPHYGIDLAAPAGSAIRAPADGVVVLANPDMHFEGGLVLIDHGQGLISMYLHQSRILARHGQTIRRGETIGEVGMTGRATGPHLCWRLRWRDRQMNPALMVGPPRVV